MIKRNKKDKQMEKEEELKEEVESIAEQLDEEIVVEDTDDLVKELQDKLLRNMAEFDNFRKRTQKEKAGMYDMGVTDTLEKLLPVADNFGRALDAISGDNEIKKGIDMIYRQFEDILKTMGLEVIDCIGKEFDANLHNAVAQGSESDKPSQTVLEELQKGYIYKDKVIRHSMVKVNS